MIFSLMKFPLLLAAMLVGATAIAQNTPPVWPMPPTLPVIPPGVNPAAYPAPKVDWLVRAGTAIAESRKIADSIKLIFDGDSITAGWQNGGEGWRKGGAEIWAQRYAKLGAFNFAIPGDGTQHVLWRLSQGQAEGLHPKLIVLLIGTNNYQPAPQIAEGIKEIVAAYQKRCPEAVILLQAIFPRGELPAGRTREKAVNELISKFADSKKVIYMDFGDKFLTPDGTLTKEIMPDLLHPSAKGYQIWADALQPVIDKYFPAK